VGVKWARSAEGGRDLNDEPRYEVAAHLFQKLFLDEADWVVPPTVLRVVPLRAYRQLDPDAGPTFEGTASVLVVLQAWLPAVSSYDAPDPGRLAADDRYARNFARLNLLTHLINHQDSNVGNVLVSRDCDRMFAVDNGMAFRSPESPRGTFWKALHTDRLPADAVARLRALTRADLDGLAIVAEYRVDGDGLLEAVTPGPRLSPHRAVVHEGRTIQLGLTDLVPSLDIHVQSALQMQDEFERWMESPQGPPPLEVKPWHNPQIHWSERIKWLNSDRMRDALKQVPQLEQVIFFHLQELMMRLAPPPAPGGGSPPAEGGRGAGRAMQNANRNAGSPDVAPPDQTETISE
jgi:hypothetical protein